ncbi:hypothetical protein DXG01_004281 [Tephrocybe rancida]|nr:hypothetical protein DXG01_004281 [Tephrocybe rancida]
MTTMFNFIPELPPVVSTAEEPDLEVPQPTRPELPVRSLPASTLPHIGPQKDVPQNVKPSHAGAGSSLKPPVPDNDNSATEESDVGDDAMDEVFRSRPSQLSASNTESRPNRATNAPRLSLVPPASNKDEPDSDSDSSPVRPAKKLKKPPIASSSDNDSEDDRKRRVAQLKGGTGPGGGKRGTRQPIKRGGKRF